MSDQPKKLFTIYIPVETYEMYDVEAATKDKAIEMVLAGEAHQIVDSHWAADPDPDNWIINEEWNPDHPTN